MPTYEYRCNACDHEFELFQAMSAAVKKKCPACSKLSLERLIGTGSAVLFKGSGFYETDYRSKSYNDAAKKDKEAASPKADSPADSKPSKTDAGAKSDAPTDRTAKPSKSAAKPE